MAKKKVPPETVDGKPVWARDSEGRPICYANLETKGRRCQTHIGLGITGRCYLHNGAGVGRPTETGGYIFPSESLMSRVAAEHDNPDLTSLRAEIAVVKSFAKKFAESFADYDLKAAWKTALNKVRKVEADLKEDRISGAKETLKELATLIEEGLGELAKFNELFGFFAKANHLIKTENAKQRDLALNISAKDQAVFVLRVGMIANKIFDKEEDGPRRALFAAELRAEVLRGPSRDSRETGEA